MDAHDDVVWSNPYDELSFRSEKYAAACTQLHLAGRNINRIKDFTGFVSLEVLWLNNNRLSSIQGLEDNFRVKFMYLHCNRFRTFDEGVVQCFIFLQQLSLNDNFLDDLNGTLAELQQLNYLKVLDLFNNPIAQEDNYRLRVIGALETLDILDRHEITDQERDDARVLKEKMKKLDNFSFKRVVKPSLEEIEEKKRHVKECNRLIGLLTRFAIDSRLFIEKDCMVVDKRDLGIVDEKFFCNTMNKYGCFDILSEKERDFILTEFRENSFPVESISKTGTLPRSNVINYRKFCRKMLPHQLRSHDDPYRFEPVPEVSVVSRDLERYVNGVKARYNEEEKKKRDSMVKSSHQTSEHHEEEKSADGPGASPKLSTMNGLSSWLMTTVLKSIRQWEKEGKGVSREQLEELFKALIKLGMIPVKGVGQVLDEIFTDSNGSELETIDIQIAKDRFQIPRKIDVPKGKSIANITIPKVDLPECIMFRALAKKEIKVLQEQCFEKADKNFQSLIRIGNSADKEFQDLFKESMTSSLHATRLANTKLLPNSPPKKWHPHEIMAAAPARSDLVVIPNLNPHMLQPRATSPSAAISKSDSRPNTGQFDSSSWSQTFSKLGSVDIYLDRAVERKRRSHTKSQAALVTTASAQQQLPQVVGHGSSSSTVATAGKETHGSTKQRVSLLELMKTSGPAPGWAPSTGTIVYS
jgi:hypothetical protein